ncbi:ROK family protein [Listeria ilorinensis]|uniref:ROK family protein n=1 Tax=Listeria ilorinensis TaxID=2867439 RepID=UPI001EF645DA|nr:ROK family protein [Listeria ilorinensis]
MTSESNLIRENNLDKLKKWLFQKGSALKAEMAEGTSISVVTINALVKELVADRTIMEAGLIQQKLGRPAIEYQFNYDKQHFCLLSMQEEDNQLVIEAKIVNLQQEVKFAAEYDFSTPTIDGFQRIIQELMAQSIDFEKIGLSFPGKIHQDIVTSSWYGKFDGWNFRELVRDLTEKPIIVQNDAHLMTIGYCLNHHVSRHATIVGIFYPKKSMPGITIFAGGRLVEGHLGLAGEAKFLSIMADPNQPVQSDVDLAQNLADIVALYNVIIAPHVFVLSSETIGQQAIEQTIETNTYLKKHPNQPAFYFDQSFQESVLSGLFWLVTQETIFDPTNF